MNKYKLSFYSIKKNKDEVKYFDNREQLEQLKNCLLQKVYIKDLEAYAFNSRSKMYERIKL